MTALFQPLSLKDVTLRNRIGVPPMCQYKATDGYANDWHRIHYGALGQGGAGLVVIEATGVAPEGRITPGCLGIWSDTHAEKLAELVRLIELNGAVAGIQIGHAGRKASADLPWLGGKHLPLSDPNAWETIAPSAVAPGGALDRMPRAMGLDDIARVKADFVAAAIRAREAGFRWLELHFAHGYLGQSFHSRHSNLREDAYGGSRENRARFLNETLEAVRAVWPENLPLTARFGVLEFDGRDEENFEDSLATAHDFKERGLDLLSVSMSNSTPNVQVPWHEPAFLAPAAKRIREETGLLTASAWGFDAPEVAEASVAQGAVDQVLIGKAHLANPHWSFYAAQRLGYGAAPSVLPPSYAFSMARYKLA